MTKFEFCALHVDGLISTSRENPPGRENREVTGSYQSLPTSAVTPALSLSAVTVHSAAAAAAAAVQAGATARGYNSSRVKVITIN